ncbi:MAG: hypothetical protein U1F04_02485 [Burkholderiaceae bacterium]
MTNRRWEDAQKALKIGFLAVFWSYRGNLEGSVEGRMSILRLDFQIFSAATQRIMATGSYGF